MKLLTCPLNGPRNISEFSYGGEVEQMPDPRAASTGEWVDYVFMHENPAGVVREWLSQIRHASCHGDAQAIRQGDADAQVGRRSADDQLVCLSRLDQPLAQ